MIFNGNQIEEGAMKVRIKSGESIKLHQFGRFALDLNDMLIFLDLLEQKKFEELKYFHIRYRPSYHYPLVKEYEDYGDKFSIERIQNGSIELILLGIGTVAGIAMPIIMNCINPKQNKVQKKIVFEVETSYSKQVDRLIEHFGSFGKFDDDKLNLLIRALEVNGYDVRWSDENKLLIRKTLDHYVRHTIRIHKLDNPELK